MVLQCPVIMNLHVFFYIFCLIIVTRGLFMENAEYARKLLTLKIDAKFWLLLLLVWHNLLEIYCRMGTFTDYSVLSPIVSANVTQNSISLLQFKKDILKLTLYKCWRKHFIPTFSLYMSPQGINILKVLKSLILSFWSPQNQFGTRKLWK